MLPTLMRTPARTAKGRVTAPVWAKLVPVPPVLRGWFGVGEVGGSVRAGGVAVSDGIVVGVGVRLGVGVELGNGVSRAGGGVFTPDVGVGSGAGSSSSSSLGSEGSGLSIGSGGHNSLALSTFEATTSSVS